MTIENKTCFISGESCVVSGGYERCQICGLTAAATSESEFYNRLPDGDQEVFLKKAARLVLRYWEICRGNWSRQHWNKPAVQMAQDAQLSVMRTEILDYLYDAGINRTTSSLGINGIIKRVCALGATGAGSYHALRKERRKHRSVYDITAQGRQSNSYRRSQSRPG